MSWFNAFLFTLVLVISGQSSALASERAEQAWQQIQQDAVLIDVRTNEEFNAGHVEGALHIPLHQLPQRLSELPAQDQAIVVYCRSGNRSGQALRFLTEQGYQRVHNGGGLSEMLATKPQ